MSKTEKYLHLILEILTNKNNRISEKKLRELLDSSKSSFHRYMTELTQIPYFKNKPLLEIIQVNNQNYYTLNRKFLTHHMPPSLEAGYFLEAYLKIGNLLKTKNFESDVKEYKSQLDIANKAEEIKRKFHYITEVNPEEQYQENSSIKEIIVSALLNNKPLSIAYQDKEYNKIYPLSLVQQKGSLYLLGGKNDLNPNNIRTFKLIRINHAEILSENFEYPPKWNPCEYFAGSSGIISGAKIKAEIKVFDVCRKIFKEKIILHSQLKKREEDFDHYTIEFTNIEETMASLFAYAQDIEIISPKDLKERFIRKAQSAISRNL